MNPEPADQAAHLRLERRCANLAFCSWRLSSTLVQAQGSVALPAPVVPPQAADTDYVTARHAALLNGLTQQPRGCYLFLEGQQGAAGAAGAAAALLLCAVELGEAGKAPRLGHVAGVAVPPADAPAGGLVGGALPPSVVEVQAPAAAADSAAGSLLLVSGGHGDVSLVAPLLSGQQGEAAAPAGSTALSPPIFPLRSAAPLLGARPLHLAAAFVLPPEVSDAPSAALGSPSGGEAQLCAIVWAPRQRSGRHPSCCEVYAVHLAAAVHPAPALRALGVQLLKSSDLPPHGVLVNPATGGVLLALQPSSGGAAEDVAAAQRAAAEAAGSSGAAPMAEDGDGEDDLSPRTLQAAVARLAAFTSEEPVGPLPHQQYADLYRESGADGVGAMGSEPTCTLYTFALATPGAARGPAATQQAGGQGHTGGQPLLRLVHSLSCQPHKLLTCHLEQPASGAQEPPTPDTHLQGGAGGDNAAGAAAGVSSGGRGGGGGGVHATPRLLLGLTDDVDCAVVAIGCASPEAAAAAGGGTSGGAAGPEEAAAGFIIQHVSSVPALSYVAAGKVQRKFLLLAPPGGDIAAALVEASKYCYVYRTTAPRQEYGEHQVVDMELPDSGGRGVLGAVLAGSRAGACRLLVLAREGLRVIDM